jgi:GT2 family glycosyltransferase
MIAESRKETSSELDASKTRALRYVLITPAHNEAEFIEQTIRSVIAQTVLPMKWVIVSDGSTDGTNDIVRKYAADNCWMQLVPLPVRAERHFAGKVHAFNAGYERVKDLDYDIIGNLDADITFEPDYFSFLLSRFQLFPELGVAGTPFREGTFQYDYRFTSIEHVSGACQLFRRECFQAIGGYVPLKVGGIDLVAVVTARMRGWKTQSFTEKFCHHHRKTQSGQHSSLKRGFKSGYHDYLMGAHPLWQFFRSLYQMSQRPFLLSGGVLLIGYLWAAVTRAEFPVSQEFIQFRRKEQMLRLKGFLKNRLASQRA